MQASLQLHILSATFGLFAGSTIVFSAPRLVAHRLAHRGPLPGIRLLAPIVGGVFAHVRPVRTAFFGLAMAALFLAFSVHYGASVRLPLASAYAWLLIAIAYIDLDHQLVLNRLSFPGCPLVVASSWLWPGFGPVNALLGAISALLLFGGLHIMGGGALGTGDIKFAILIGAMRGVPGVFTALLLGIILGSLWAAFRLIVLRRGRKETIAYAPFMAAGALASFFFVSP